MIRQKEMVTILRHRCEAAGGQRQLAQAYGVSPAFISDVVNGRRVVTARLARLMGYQRDIVFSACKTPDCVAE